METNSPVLTAASTQAEITIQGPFNGLFELAQTLKDERRRDLRPSRRNMLKYHVVMLHGRAVLESGIRMASELWGSFHVAIELRLNAGHQAPGPDTRAKLALHRPAAWAEIFGRSEARRNKQQMPHNSQIKMLNLI
jgi:hypothetical protein